MTLAWRATSMTPCARVSAAAPPRPSSMAERRESSSSACSSSRNTHAPMPRGALLRARNSSLEAHQCMAEARHAASARPGSMAMPRPTRNWFAEAVPSLVSRLARGGSEPSAHVVHARGAADCAAAHCWSGVVLPVEGEGVVLVRPIPSPTEAPSARALPAPGSDGILSPASYAAEAHGSSPYTRQQQREGGSSRVTSYYGVVVQSRAAAVDAGSSSSAPHCTGDGQGAGCDGCYVLKLCCGGSAEAGSPGCTHYTLTRVCQGAALDMQLLAPWLQCADARALESSHVPTPAAPIATSSA